MRPTRLGLPVAVGRTLELPRAPTDREWGMVLADLRQTFQAEGREVQHGPAHGWVNGIRLAWIEPTKPVGSSIWARGGATRCRGETVKRPA